MGRIRTLIGSSGLPMHFWPLAARWAAEAHNRSVLDQPRLPAFGQQVLHRVKQPADGTRQIMHRWVVARYASPHSSIPEGHVLVTGEGKPRGIPRLPKRHRRSRRTPGPKDTGSPGA